MHARMSAVVTVTNFTTWLSYGFKFSLALLHKLFQAISLRSNVTAGWAWTLDVSVTPPLVKVSATPRVNAIHFFTSWIYNHNKISPPKLQPAKFCKVASTVWFAMTVSYSRKQLILLILDHQGEKFIYTLIRGQSDKHFRGVAYSTSRTSLVS